VQPCASEKITFPDMWTNTCGLHPLDGFEGEKIEDQLGVRIIASGTVGDLYFREIETSFDNLSTTVYKTNRHMFDGIRFVLQFLIPSRFCNQIISV
jgi:hypothetical protein